jgi:hypothetical protein
MTCLHDINMRFMRLLVAKARYFPHKRGIHIDT